MPLPISLYEPIAFKLPHKVFNYHYIWKGLKSLHCAGFMRTNRKVGAALMRFTFSEGVEQQAWESHHHRRFYSSRLSSCRSSQRLSDRDCVHHSLTYQALWKLLFFFFLLEQWNYIFLLSYMAFAGECRVQ